MNAGTPHVSVLIPVWNGGASLEPALRSVLDQTFADFELVVVDDGSDDGTPDVLNAVTDRRLRIVRSDARLGVAGALNLGLEAVTGAVVARMDADDLAEPDWLESLVTRLEREPRIGIVGGGLVELPPEGEDAGAVHLLPEGVGLTRWRSLFGTPFFHNAVAFDRSILERNGLRYDPALEGAEDFDLWTRFLRVVDGDTVARALVRYRTHPGQASTRSADRLLRLRREIALREIQLVAPTLDPGRAELAWRLADARPLPARRVGEAVEALLAVLDAFERSAGRGVDPVVRAAAARAIARGALRAGSPRLARRALALDPALPLRIVGDRRRRRQERRRLAVAARPGGPQPATPLRVTVVSPEPTPYRSPLFDRVAEVDGLCLTVIYASSSLQGRTWTVATHHEAVVLEGRSLPGASAILRHDYPITAGVLRELRTSRPDVCVVAGWSTFASQAAIAWCRRHDVPYVLHVESNDHDRRSGWRRRVKSAVADPVVARAAHVLVVGSLARESVVARGADPARVSVFANTIDVEAFGETADRLASQREALRAELGLAQDDVAILCVARLSPEKALDSLVRAVAAADDPRLALVLVGGGPERERLVELAGTHGVRLVLPGDIPWSRIVERYVAADVFALVSTRETWGVVVNEAAACGLPLILSDRVGAARDLLVDGENGVLVPAGDVPALSRAIGTLADDPGFRASAGDASRRIVSGWGYGPSVDAFVTAVRAASSR